MDIEGKTIWQQAAGDNDRNYAQICLKWDVILNGPGRAGPWPDGPVRDWLRELAIEPKTSERTLASLPPLLTQNKIGVSEISDFLFDHS